MLSDAQRDADFPSLASRCYLNTAAEGIPPRQVVAALTQYAEDKLLGMDGRTLHEAQWRGARQRTAAAYGFAESEIGLCSCTSEAYNLLASAMRLQPGDEVVINDLDFPAGATAWMQPECPATVKLWRARDGVLELDDLRSLLSPRTRLVTVSYVSFYNGFKLPLDEAAALVRSSDRARLAVDVTQALGRIPLPLEGVDFVVSSTHKWILASHGGGLVGVSADAAAELTAPAGGWFHLQNAFDDDRFERVVTKQGGASYGVGMPNYAAVYAINAALEYIDSLSVDQIEKATTPLVHACLEGLEQLDVELLTPPRPESLAGILAFRHPAAERIYERLHEQDIHVMHHAGRLRVALHFYNTMADVEKFLAGMRDAVK